MKKILFMAATVLFLTSCSSSQKENSTEGAFKNSDPEAASLAKISGIPYSETTVNKKDSKKVLVISSSARKGGNTDLLADEFARGAKEAGGNVEKVNLAEMNLEFLSEEGANQPKEVSHSSETYKLMEKFLTADVVCLASPTYYMNVNDRMKTFIDDTFLVLNDDRMTPKEFYYITACWDPSEFSAEWCFNGFRGFVMCLPHPTERGYVKAVGMGQAGAVKDTDFMKQAYQLGLGINK